MMNRGFSRREKILMLLLAVLFVAAVYYLVIHDPSRASIAQAQERTAELDTIMIVENARAEQIAKMTQALESIDYGKDAKYVTPEYDNAKNVVSLLNQALETSLEYNLSFRPVEFVGDLAVREIQMVFRCAGYRDAKSIMRELYTGPYRCEITAFQLEPLATEDAQLATGELKVTLAIVYYETHRQ